jgi:hypothetical protein
MLSHPHTALGKRDAGYTTSGKRFSVVGLSQLGRPRNAQTLKNVIVN